MTQASRLEKTAVSPKAWTMLGIGVAAQARHRLRQHPRLFDPAAAFRARPLVDAGRNSGRCTHFRHGSHAGGVGSDG